MVTRRLLICYSLALLHLFYAAFHEVPRDTDFDKNVGIIVWKMLFFAVRELVYAKCS